MATEGAALSHLRDVYYILTHDLAGSDLVDLKSRFGGPPATITLDNAALVAPIVSKLASTMLSYNTAVDTANGLTVSGQKSTFFMMGLVGILTTVVIGIMLYVLITLMMYKYRVEHAGYAVLVPEIGKILIAGMAFVAFMLTWMLMLQARRLELTHNADILKVGFWRIHNLVGGAYAMRFEAALQQGTLPDFVKNQDNVNGGSTLIPGDDCEGDAEDRDPVSCSRQINPCGVKSPTLAEVIVNSCPLEISSMLGELDVIKTEGIDQYDRTALWKQITVGIEAIRRTVSVSADADTSAAPSQPLQATEAQTMITSQILPLLESTDVKAIGTALLEKPDAATVKTIRVDHLLPMLDHMTSEILAVIQKLKYDVNIEDYREYLDTALAAFYGSAYPPIRFDLVSVVDKVQKAADARPATASMLYVDSATMLGRVTDMGPAAWTDFVLSTDVTKAAVHTFLSKFKLPSAAPSAGIKITNMIASVLTLTGFLLLIMYVTDTMHRLDTSKIDKQVAARHIVIGACLYALATVLTHAMIQRMIDRLSHNWDAIKKNGQRLAYSLETTKEAAIVIESSTSLVAADAQNYIDTAIITVRAYDDCNSVTNGASVMPFPLMEVVIYSFVIVVLMASALYGADHLKPFEKVSNIRTLMRLHERVKDGDVPGGMVKQLECCTPNQEVWHILMWIAVSVLFCLNLFVMSNVQTTNTDYQQSLKLLDNCV